MYINVPLCYVLCVCRIYLLIITQNDEMHGVSGEWPHDHNSFLLNHNKREGKENNEKSSNAFVSYIIWFFGPQRYIIIQYNDNKYEKRHEQMMLIK